MAQELALQMLQTATSFSETFRFDANHHLIYNDETREKMVKWFKDNDMLIRMACSVHIQSVDNITAQNAMTFYAIGYCAQQNLIHSMNLIKKTEDARKIGNDAKKLKANE